MDSFGQKQTKESFTLIELLVALAIIGVLLAIFMPAIGRVRKSARSALCCNNLRQLFLAAVLFSEDRGHYPKSYLPDIEPDFLSKYLDNEKGILHCPEVKGYFDDEPPVYSYGYFWQKKKSAQQGTRFTLLMEKQSSHVPMFADSSGSGVSNQYVFNNFFDNWLARGYGNPYDFSGDGIVNFVDYAILTANLPKLTYRHSSHANIIYLDGHVEEVKR